MASTIGNYKVSNDDEVTRIFPENKDGERIVVTLQRHYLYLTSVVTGRLTVFRKYRHQGRWYWSDSRDNGKSCRYHEVEHEVARMLFEGCRGTAKVMLGAWGLGA
jgi:hypothetical protein